MFEETLTTLKILNKEIPVQCLVSAKDIFLRTK